LKRLLKRILSAFRSPWNNRVDVDRLAPPAIIEKADQVLREVRLAQERAEIDNAARRHADRMARFRAWCAAENIEARRIEHEASAAAALEKAQAMSKHAREALGMPLEDPPLPPEDQLPKEMRGQAVSTIRAMLRQKNWTYDGSGWKPPKPKFAVVEGPIERCWRQEFAPTVLKEDE
jgi:hypothetical protein